MKGIPPIVIVAVMLAVVLGVPFGLYALLTRGRRRLTREIRAAASARGWKFRRRRWQGDPTAFRIEGWGSGGNWVLQSGGAGETNRGSSVDLSLRFPALAGEVDVAVLPRDSTGHGGTLRAPHLSREAQARLASFSGTAASAAGFLRDAQEVPSGLPEFDAAYQVLAPPARVSPPPVDAALAQRLRHWSADALAPHSVLAWRDPFGFHVQARLPSTPDWATLTHFITLGEDFAARLPAPSGGSAPQGFVDAMVARFLRT